MKILLACECSGIARDAFIRKGHQAISCDLLPTDRPGPHIQGNVIDQLNNDWDMMIAFPPCTYLTVTGNRWFNPRWRDRFPERAKQRQDAIDFFMAFADADIPKIGIENPIGIMSSVWRKPDQIIQPYYFGHNASKATCLWLKGLPRLLHERDLFFPGYEHIEPDFVIHKSGRRMSKWYYETSCKPHSERAKARSDTFQGIADAMAEQCG